MCMLYIRNSFQIYGETECVIHVINFVMYFLLKDWRNTSFGEANTSIEG